MFQLTCYSQLFDIAVSNDTKAPYLFSGELFMHFIHSSMKGKFEEKLNYAYFFFHASLIKLPCTTLFYYLIVFLLFATEIYIFIRSLFHCFVWNDLELTFKVKNHQITDLIFEEFSLQFLLIMEFFYQVNEALGLHMIVMFTFGLFF